MFEELIDDFPKGPLDEYRTRATFNWKSLKMAVENDPEYLKLKLSLWKTLSQDPIFQRKQIMLTTGEMKKLSAKRLYRYLQMNFFPSNMMSLPYKRRLRLMMAVNEAMALAYPDVSIKHAIGIGVVKNILSTLGTERHKAYLEASWNGKMIACVSLTEVAHGSNTKKMKTTATFDQSTQEFVINTPDFQSAKCWSGNLGKIATMSILFAQLITSGQNHGLHAFIVPIRDPRTLLPYPGITVGDMGEKIGLHGIDNGFVMFDNYRIPRENLLNRTGDVTPDGDYESSFSEPGKILGAALENLSLARVGIMQESVNTLINAVTIAVRYGAVRRQFSDSESEIELPLLEYQLHKWRLFPYVSASVVLKFFVISFTDDYLNAVEESNTSDRLDEINNLVSEIHSIVSGAKPLITWITRDAIQECREACGGHGYLKNAGLGDLRNDHDPSVTYEGDNNVLLQQSSNWLLKQWHSLTTHGKVYSPLSTAEFFIRHHEILSRKYLPTDNIQDFKYILDCYEWLITYLVKEISSSLEQLQSLGYSKFEARNSTQVYRSHLMSKCYAELNALRYFWIRMKSFPRELQSVLNQLGMLYGLFSLDRHISFLYEGGFCTGPHFTRAIKNSILKICEELTPNVVGIVDALAPPDFIINSILGNSDGKIYERLKDTFFGNPENMARPEWWQEVIIPDAPNFKKTKSKL